MKIILILAAIATISLSCMAQSDKDSRTMQLRKLQMAQVYISALYVDSISDVEVTENAIRGMLEKLDPHSTYSTPEEVKKFNEPLQGGFEGIGVQFNMVEDTLLVIQPTSKGPSQKAGILAGDRIVSVNDTVIAGVKMPQEEIMKRLRGPKGTKVRLSVIRRGVNDKIDFEVTRDKIPVHSVVASYMVSDDIGLIRLDNFAMTTHQEMLQAVKELESQGMRKLILDLQDNGGGYLHAATEIANEFLSAGDMIVYTEGNAQRRQNHFANGRGSLKDMPLAILVNQNSASAAEILTGAIQDQDRGTVIGRRTFGKGLVQRPVDLPDGSMIRLTVARYYTPTGRSIQKPYVKGEKDAYHKDIINRLESGELSSQDSIHLNDSLSYKTLKKNRVVYGGGGIVPDYFIALDTTRTNTYYGKLALTGSIVKSTIKYVDQNRDELHRTYKDFRSFSGKFTVDDKLWKTLMAEADKAGIKEPGKDELEQARSLINRQLKALVARDLWDMSEYYQVMSSEDEMVKKAVEILNLE